MSLRHAGCQPVAHFRRFFLAAEVRGHEVLSKGLIRDATKRVALFSPPEKVKHHRCRQNRAQRIGNSPSGYVRRRTVHRLEERSLARMNVTRGSQPQTAD